MFNPRFTITPPLLAAIKRVAVLVYRLNEHFPQPAQRESLRLETRSVSAHASTTIEGNPLSLTAVRQLLKKAPEHADLAEREVINYDQAAQLLENQPFDEEVLLQAHAVVMRGLLLPAKSGLYRLEPVFVHDPRSGQVIYWPPDHADVPALMRELLEFVAGSSDLDPLIRAGIFHKQFVLVHPFIDGNGRTVRLATAALLKGLGLDLSSLVSFEEYYARDVTRYFAFVGATGSYYDLEVDHTAWLEYFAAGILDELRHLEQVLEASHGAPARPPATRLKAHHELILHNLRQHGAITDREYAGMVTRAKSTRALDFKRLMELNLIARRGRGPATYYVLVTAADTQ